MMMKGKVIYSLLVLFQMTTAENIFSNCTTARKGLLTTFKERNLDGHFVNLIGDFGHVTIVTNVASFSELTTPNYVQLNSLLQKYGGDEKCSLKVMAFPCNQFGHQEPAANKVELLNTLRYVRPGYGFEPKMEMFSKVNVNGDKESVAFTYLKKACPAPGNIISSSSTVSWIPIRTSDVYWNFEKFLVDHKGTPIKRYSAESLPMVMENEIKELIKLCRGDLFNGKMVFGYHK